MTDTPKTMWSTHIAGKEDGICCAEAGQPYAPLTATAARTMGAEYVGLPSVSNYKHIPSGCAELETEGTAVVDQLITTPFGCGYNWHSTVPRREAGAMNPEDKDAGKHPEPLTATAAHTRWVPSMYVPSVSNYKHIPSGCAELETEGNAVVVQCKHTLKGCAYNWHSTVGLPRREAGVINPEDEEAERRALPLEPVAAVTYAQAREYAEAAAAAHAKMFKQ